MSFLQKQSSFWMCRQNLLWLCQPTQTPKTQTQPKTNKKQAINKQKQHVVYISACKVVITPTTFMLHVSLMLNQHVFCVRTLEDNAAILALASLTI